MTPVLLLFLSAPQMQDMPRMRMPGMATSACTPEHAAMGHCRMPTRKAAQKPRPTSGRRATPVASKREPLAQPQPMPMPATPTIACAPEHAAMGHCTAAPVAPPAPSCAPEHAAMGHCTPPPSTSLPPQTIGNAPPPPAAPATYADRIWGADAMAASRTTLRREHSGGRFSQLMLNRLEIAPGDGGYRWDGDAWFGGDIDRVVLKSEGEGTARLDDADATLLYSRAVGPYFNAQAGIRRDFGAGPSRTSLSIGVKGLAPYWFDVEAHAFLSTEGELRAEFSADYDQRLTQRLILQPRVEFDLAAQDIPERDIRSGLSSAELGLRLRYEVAREFAPYVGVVHERRWGADAASSTGVVLGVRAWF